MQPSCLFCRIANKELPAQMVFEDEFCVAFRDINPQAPVHLLVVPKKHFPSAGQADEADEPVLGHLHRVAAKLAHEHNLTEGHRVVMNTGEAAGQSVLHVHLHLLGGRSLGWPPG